MHTLIERGHEVTVYEKSDRIGGTLIGAAAPRIKFDLKDYVMWLNIEAQKVVKAGMANILLNSEATIELLELESYDAVIIAVGAEPIVPRSVPGITRPNVFWVSDALTKDCSKVGKRVVVVGAGDVGMQIAHHFAEDENEIAGIIDIVVKSPFSFSEMDSLLDEKGIKVQYSPCLCQVTENGVIVKDAERPLSLRLTPSCWPWACALSSIWLSRCAIAPPRRNVTLLVTRKKIGGNISAAVNGAFQTALHV